MTLFPFNPSAAFRLFGVFEKVSSFVNERICIVRQKDTIRNLRGILKRRSPLVHPDGVHNMGSKRQAGMSMRAPTRAMEIVSAEIY